MNALAPDTSHNSSFSKAMPGLQLAIDSTSLGEFKLCPKRYYYSIVLGYQPRAESVHLKFGILLHQAREHYEHARTGGQDHDSALDHALDLALRATWDQQLNKPWVSDHKQKHRLSLIQTIVWYLDAKAKDDPLRTITLANGKPAVELSFRFDSGWRSQSTGEPILFCGHLDRLAEFNSEYYIPDIKTTSHSLDPNWFASWSPGNQFSMYSLAGKVAFGLEIKSIIVDGIQVGSGFSRFMRAPVERKPETIDEWYAETGVWLGQMDECAAKGQWHMNDKSCDAFGGCPFRPVCSRPPSAREAWLKKDYAKRVWDPLQIRGDV